MLCLLTACEQEGPAEKAGKKADQAVEGAKKFEQAKEKIEEKVDPDGPAAKIGEKIDQTVEEVKEKTSEYPEELSRSIVCMSNLNRYSPSSPASSSFSFPNP